MKESLARAYDTARNTVFKKEKILAEGDPDKLNILETVKDLDVKTTPEGDEVIIGKLRDGSPVNLNVTEARLVGTIGSEPVTPDLEKRLRTRDLPVLREIVGATVVEFHQSNSERT